jgi:hypothetical protein
VEMGKIVDLYHSLWDEEPVSEPEIALAAT